MDSYYYDDGFVEFGEQPYYLDTNTGNTVATNLNDLQFDEGFGVPVGWYIFKAHGINNLGDIACALALEGDIGQRRGCVIELRPDPTDLSLKPRIHLIPDGEWTQAFARSVNDVGVILGFGDAETGYVYHAPLHGQTGDASVTIIPTAFHVWYANGYLTNPINGGPTLVKAILYATKEILTYDVDTGALSLTDVSNLNLARIRGFNDLGGFCGEYWKKKRQERGFSFDGGFHALDDVEYADDLNNDRDVICLANGRRPVLNHPDHGTILLDDTIVAENDVEQAIWDNSGGHRLPTLSERNATGFPVVAGTMTRLDSSYTYFFDGYVLFPITPDP